MCLETKRFTYLDMACSTYVAGSQFGFKMTSRILINVLIISIFLFEVVKVCSPTDSSTLTDKDSISTVISKKRQA